MEKLSVIKIGGQVLEDNEQMMAFVKTLSKRTDKTIIVHGGGKTASEISIKLGIKPQMIEGRRVTSPEDLEVVTMVYAGLLNKKLVSQLQANSLNAIGLTGADGLSILSEKRVKTPIDYGHVGDVKTVNGEFIKSLLDQNLIPVFCALTYSNGALLNTNADTVATEIAKALTSFYKVGLTFCFEKEGILNSNHEVFPQINRNKYDELKQGGIIHSGMLPKTENAFDALANGVKKVVIGSIHSIDSKAGTVISL